MQKWWHLSKQIREGYCTHFHFTCGETQILESIVNGLDVVVHACNLNTLESGMGFWSSRPDRVTSVILGCTMRPCLKQIDRQAGRQTDTKDTGYLIGHS